LTTVIATAVEASDFTPPRSMRRLDECVQLVEPAPNAELGDRMAPGAGVDAGIKACAAWPLSRARSQ
jgi:hypothetical protein